MTTTVVKTASDDGGSHPCDRWWVETLLERLEWILVERFAKNKSKMSLGCGLSRQHVERILSRLRTNEDSDIKLETLAKIANGSRVRIDWLAEGKPPRDLSAIAVDEVDPRSYVPQGLDVDRAILKAIDLALSMGATEEVVSDTLLMLAKGGEGMDPIRLADMIVRESARRKLETTAPTVAARRRGTTIDSATTKETIPSAEEARKRVEERRRKRTESEPEDKKPRRR